MTTASTQPAPDSPAATTELAGAPHEPTRLWVDRTGSRTYTGRSSRGAEVAVAGAGTPGAFTPGELLKIALAACSGMSTDVPIARRLGDDYAVRIDVSGDADRERENYPQLREVLNLDLSELAEADIDRLVTVITRAIDRSCTVGNTLKAGAEITLEIPR